VEVKELPTKGAQTNNLIREMPKITIIKMKSPQLNHTAFCRTKFSLIQ
jgi:hypothetical protein